MKDILETKRWLNDQPQEIQDIIDDVIWASIGVVEEAEEHDPLCTLGASYSKVKMDILRHALDKEYRAPEGKWENQNIS